MVAASWSRWSQSAGRPWADVDDIVGQILEARRGRRLDASVTLAWFHTYAAAARSAGVEVLTVA